MENAQEILIIILSVTLTLFLLFNIALLILVIKLVKSVKRVTDKAEAVVGKAEAAADVLSHAATPIMVGKLISSVFDNFKPKSKRK